VVLTDVNETALQAATDDLTAAGHQVIGTIATPMVTDMIDKGELDLDVAKANQPINRLGSPEEIAASVPWLTSPGAGFVIGVALPVDGGYTAQ
jgi:NAD(P)-dependent dehydrogenase (short-subunit alcohol dehydrogenase family)